MTGEVTRGVSLAAGLDAALAALRLDGSPKQRSALLAYLGLLQKWCATYNLTAIREPDRMLTHHVVDSLSIVSAIRRHLRSTPVRRVIDAGSGAGLPGVVLAVMCPDLEVICIDSVGKKTSFVRQVAAEVPISNLQAMHSRLELVRDLRAEVVTSRALATLADMVKATRALLEPGGVWMAMKGKPPASEIAALPPDIEVFHVEPLTVPGLDADRCLMWLRCRAAH